MPEARPHEKYEALIYACHALAPVRTAVAHPCDETSLCGAVEAAEAKIITPILVGPPARIRALAAKLKLDISPYQLVETPTVTPLRPKPSRSCAMAKLTP